MADGSLVGWLQDQIAGGDFDFWEDLREDVIGDAAVLEVEPVVAVGGEEADGFGVGAVEAVFGELVAVVVEDDDAAVGAEGDSGGGGPWRRSWRPAAVHVIPLCS